MITAFFKRKSVVASSPPITHQQSQHHQRPQAAESSAPGAAHPSSTAAVAASNGSSQLAVAECLGLFQDKQEFVQLFQRFGNKVLCCKPLFSKFSIHYYSFLCACGAIIVQDDKVNKHLRFAEDSKQKMRVFCREHQISTDAADDITTTIPGCTGQAARKKLNGVLICKICDKYSKSASWFRKRIDRMRRIRRVLEILDCSHVMGADALEFLVNFSRGFKHRKSMAFSLMLFVHNHDRWMLQSITRLHWVRSLLI